MGATNHTTNYGFSQFIGTDKPSWLNDYNGDMSAIDAAIKGASDDAAIAQSTATNAANTATSASNTASALSTQINTPVTGLAAVVSGNTSAIGSLQGQAGSAALITTAQTFSEAINELATQNGTDALTTTAQTLSGAINELNNVISGDTIEVTGEVGETYSAAIDRLHALMDRSKLKVGSKFERIATNGNKIMYSIQTIFNDGHADFTSFEARSTTLYAYLVSVKSSASTIGNVGVPVGANPTVTWNNDSNSAAAGVTFRIYY